MGRTHNVLYSKGVPEGESKARGIRTKFVKVKPTVEWGQPEELTRLHSCPAGAFVVMTVIRGTGNTIENWP